MTHAAIATVAATASLSLILLASAARSQTTNDDFARGSVTVKDEKGEDLLIPYRLLAPRVIEPGKSYPLILFLHGAGERGDDGDAVLRHFPELMARPPQREARPCFLLAPQCPKGRRWAEVDWSAAASTPMDREASPAMRGAIAALAKVLAEHEVDRDRIALTGLSMGGFGSFDLAARHPDWFSSVLAICGGGDESRARALAGLPILVRHGTKDPTVPVDRSRGIVRAIRAAGGEVELIEYPEVGHDAWTKAYAEPEALDRLLGSRRSQRDDGVAGLRPLRHQLARSEHDETIVFLGDSITQSGDREGGYVDRIRRGLAGDPATARHVIVPAGISGNRVPDLLARLDKDVIEKKPTLVWIYIGINDVWHSTKGRGTSKEDYESGMRELLTRIGKTGATIVLATPSVIGEKRRGTNPLDPMLEDYAAISRRVAAEFKVAICDLRRDMPDHLAVFNSADAEEGCLTRDGVHLSDDGNRYVAHAAALALAEALAARQ